MRPSKDQWGLELAKVVASRATCLRRQVGCVLVDARGRVLATGYNGVAAGQPHCNERVAQGMMISGVLNPQDLSNVVALVDYPHACPGAQSPSGTNLDGCEAIHAEQNALLQCRDVDAIDACYCTASPCITCVKLLLNTSCSRIVFLEAYPHKAAEALWAKAGRAWQLLGLGRSS